ncbi:hypothetical protein [Viridibacterium curvum]|uniref:Transcriptional regulator n=1 Tax=Viridibacterium curvum TaxID=1101404 RepID=A0ABP9R678_9RHOO
MEPRIQPLHYDYTEFALAKAFFFRAWCEFARERGALLPIDLSGACKYGSLFMHDLYGGVIEGHYAHQYNRIAGRLVDLSHDASDVGAMREPYSHDPAYFDIPEYRVALIACQPRVDRWVSAYLLETGS